MTILFVCSGNTCRSPMAAAILQRLLPGALSLGGKNTWTEDTR